jgi:serine/threonine-protein kinase
MGTPHYMSPEQAKGHVEDIDERTDQWALACIVWECLAGQGPFVGENVPSILFQIVHEPPAGLAPKVAGLPSQVEDVLLRALAKDKNDRFANVNDFALALERASGAAVATVVGRPEIVARPAQDPPAAQPTTFSHTAGELDALAVPRSRPKWIWALAAGAALGLLLAGFLLLRPGSAAKPVVASPPPVAPAPPVATAPPVPPPPPQALPPAAVAPSAPEIKTEPPPEPKAKTSHSPDGVARKKRQPAKKPSEEGQDIWRVE